MCGITGFYHFSGRPASEGPLRRMVDAIAHRGPDGEGFYTGGPVALPLYPGMKYEEFDHVISGITGILP